MEEVVMMEDHHVVDLLELRLLWGLVLGTSASLGLLPLALVLPFPLPKRYLTGNNGCRDSKL